MLLKPKKRTWGGGTAASRASSLGERGKIWGGATLRLPPAGTVYDPLTRSRSPLGTDLCPQATKQSAWETPPPLIHKMFCL